MDALGNMTEEHMLILRAIGVLEAAAGNIRSGRSVPSGTFDEIVDFLKNFADRCHHGKEEDVLFPAVRVRGDTEEKVVKSLLDDHVNGRKFVQGLVKSSAESDLRGIASNASGYVKLLRTHIQKEEAIFPVWIAPLPKVEKEAMAKKFEDMEKRTIGPSGRGKYEDIVGKLESLD